MTISGVRLPNVTVPTMYAELRKLNDAALEMLKQRHNVIADELKTFGVTDVTPFPKSEEKPKPRVDSKSGASPFRFRRAGP
jgi:hypothetical protein